MSWFRRKIRRRNDAPRTEAGDQRGGHASAPTRGAVPDNILQAALAAGNSEYGARIRELGAQLDGRIVADSAAGHSGYVLRLVDGGWVAVWLDPQLDRMEFSAGDGDIPSDLTPLLSNPSVPDASAPLDIDRPYAGEANDIASEACGTQGRPITGVAVGERDFSLCFPDGMELEGTVFRNAAGRYVLRVFYEQW